MAKVKTHSASEAKQTAPVNEENIERRSRREIVTTIANWISERRKNNRLAEIAAIRKMFGGESQLREN